MEANKILLEAIALQKCLGVTYNRTLFTLAPYILYTRHDELYVDAVPLETNGRPPREVKLATFKVAGLSDLVTGERRFAPDPAFNPRDERYDGTTLFAVEFA
jgi:hypothetical protein